MPEDRLKYSLRRMVQSGLYNLSHAVIGPCNLRLDTINHSGSILCFQNVNISEAAIGTI